MRSPEVRMKSVSSQHFSRGCSHFFLEGRDLAVHQGEGMGIPLSSSFISYHGFPKPECGSEVLLPCEKAQGEKLME